MRITNHMMVDSTVKQLSDAQSYLFDLQTKASTGKVYQHASDDPAAAATVFSLKTSLAISQVYQATAESTSEWMAVSDNALQTGSTITIKAKNLVLAGLSDSIGPSERKAMADEINGLVNQAIDLGNSSHLGRYIFAGYNTNVKPFVPTMDLIDPTMVASVAYKPLPLPQPPVFQPLQRDIGPGETVTANVDGDAAFSNLINSLIAARDALNANDTVTLRTVYDNGAASGLTLALEQVTHASTANGARMKNIDDTVTRVKANNVEIQSLISQKEEVNMADVLSQIQNQTIIYQTVVQVSARTSSMMNLFDKLG